MTNLPGVPFRRVAALLAFVGVLGLGPAANASTFAQLIRAAKPVYCGGVRGREVALTFDDGPSPYTMRLVRVLRQERARATFFVIGNRLGFWPAAVRAARRVGTLGNHTWSHPHLSGLGAGAVRNELARTQRGLARASGGVPRLFRPPYEQASPAQDRIARSLGLLDVRWSIDAGDAYPSTTPAQAVRTVVARLRPGAIVLLHDLHPWTPDAVRLIVRAARRKGLRVVSVPELLKRQPPSRRQRSSTGASRCPPP